MINHVYQLIQPKVISVKYEDVSLKDRVIIRPNYMAICHADQRYYQGQRDVAVLNKKLPMALIHECCGTVLSRGDDPAAASYRGGRSGSAGPGAGAKTGLV